ncbi:MAG: hypothetical protein Q4B85_13175 [Lachnospiraceae bacterium]|nr:hypothetical protein [Lachnospiraceae bacterium]
MRKGFINKLLAITVSAALAGTGCLTCVSPVHAEEPETEISQEGEISEPVQADGALQEADSDAVQTEGDLSDNQETASEQDVPEGSIVTVPSADPEESDSAEGDNEPEQPSDEFTKEMDQDTEMEDEAEAAALMATDYSDWDGISMSEPSMNASGEYLIGNGAQLNWFRNEVNERGRTSIKGILTADINLGNHPWTPIGTLDVWYTGSFNGNGYRIYNLYINNTADKYNSVGLFGFLTEGGIIENLTVDGSITSANATAGGIVGWVWAEDDTPAGTINNCINYVDITINDSNSIACCGGIVGGARSLEIDSCINYGTITTNGKGEAGGIAGYVDYTWIDYCVNRGNITGYDAGGIIGLIYFYGSAVENCYNTGDIKGDHYVAGLVGQLNYSSLYHGYNTGNITYRSNAGAILNPCANDTYKGSENDHLWYTNSFSGSVFCGTYCTMEELCNSIKIDGFYSVCNDTPALQFERKTAHSVDAYEERIGYKTGYCKNCGALQVLWNDERLRVVDYDEDVVDSISVSEPIYEGDYPWQIINGGLKNGNAETITTASNTDFSFSVTEDAVFQFDYDLNAEEDMDLFTVELFHPLDQGEILRYLISETYTGRKTGRFTEQLEPGDYFFYLTYYKKRDAACDGDYCKITNISIKPSQGLKINAQPQSVESAKIGQAISYGVNASNVASYQWQYSKDGKTWYNSTASSAKTDTLNLTLSESNKANRYRCKLTDYFGEVHYTEAASVKQVIYDGFKITAQPQSVASAKIGDVISYSVTAQHASTYQWQYSKDGKEWFNSSIPSAKTSTMTVTLSASNKANRYRCRITDDKGVVHYSSTVYVQQVISFAITSQPADWDVTKGKAASFSVTATEAASYQWQYSKDRGKNWVKSSITPTLNNGTSTIKVNIAPSNAANVYRCKVTGKDGTVLYTRTAIFKGAPIVTGQPNNVTYQAGKTAVFTATVSNASVCSFQWQYSKDGGKTWYNSTASGAKTKALSLTMKSANLTMVYRCKITGNNNVYLYTNTVKLVK